MPFNFSDVWWLALVLIIPAVTALYALYYRGRVALDRLKAFADAHLLPHLLKDKTGMQQSVARPLILWSIVWLSGALAMAGPRWNYTDVQTGTPNRSLVILLDLSKSMDAQDVKPSRIERAKQEIGDIIDASHATNIGLIAFAAIPHMVVPLTDDMATIRYLMPSLDTNLVGVQGSRLAPAIEMAGLMLRGAPGKDKSILVVSDGGMADLAEAMRAIPADVRVYAMGVGTAEGAPIPAENGGWIQRPHGGGMVIAQLEAEKLKAMADAGKGIYVTADYTDNDTHNLLLHIEAGPQVGTAKTGRTVRIWDEKFYIPALVMALIMLPWFRRGYVFPVILILTLWPAPARADLGDLFMNPAQQARAAYDQRDYEGAAEKFDTPYRKGVAQYRAQQFDKAEQSFAQDSDPSTMIDSEYNKGNAQLMQGKADDAIASYEDVLKQRPDDKAAAKNLEIAKKMREQKQKKDDNKPDQQKDSKNDQKQDQKQDKKQDQKQQDKQQQQQAQNNQQQDQRQEKSGDQQQKDKQGQQQQKSQSGEKQQQDKQGESQKNGEQKQAENGQPQDKQQQKDQQSQAGHQSQQEQAQNGQNQSNLQQEKQAQDKNYQQHTEKGQDNQEGQQHNEQQQGQPDKGNGQQQAQNGQEKDKNRPAQDKQGTSNEKNAKSDQQYPPQPGSAENIKNQGEQNAGSEKQPQEQKGGDDKDKQQAAQQGKQDDQKQDQNGASQQAQQKQGDDKQKQQEQAAQQAQGGSGDKQKQQQQQAQAGGEQDKNQNTGNQQQPRAQNNQGNSSAQQQSYDNNGQPSENQSAYEHSGQIMNGQPHPRSQKDVDADQWLNRAVSDPGPFLKNQFGIDASRNPPPEEEDPW